MLGNLLLKDDTAGVLLASKGKIIHTYIYMHYILNLTSGSLKVGLRVYLEAPGSLRFRELSTRIWETDRPASCRIASHSLCGFGAVRPLDTRG